MFAHWAIVYFKQFLENYTKMGWVVFWAIFSQMHLLILDMLRRQLS
jgi:hypothetical protein